MNEPTQTPRTDADKLADALTKIDLYRDEFLRIKACPNVDSEVAGLCDRALSDIKAHFPITVQLENAENARRAAEREAAHMKDTWRKWPKVSCDEMQRVIKGSSLGDGYVKLADMTPLDESEVSYWAQRIMDEIEEVFTRARIEKVVREMISALSPPPPAVEKVEHQTVDYPLRLIEHTDGRMEWRDDAPVEVERWAKEKAAHKAGKRIQFRQLRCTNEWTEWTNCISPLGPSWIEHTATEYRIHPDDDAPPVQTEEKPATFQASTK